MSLEAIEKFIGDVAVHYPTPKHGGAEAEAAWLRSMVAELRGATPEVLDRAARHIIQTRKYRNFPLVAECREAVRKAAEEVNFNRHLETLPHLRKTLGDEWSTERVKLAYDLIKSGMGKQAARDNPCWIKCLWDFCRKNQRLPDHREQDRLMREASEFEASYRQCLSGNAGPLSVVLMKLGDSMIAKREQLCAEVLRR